jgi:hypothetical protein
VISLFVAVINYGFHVGVLHLKLAQQTNVTALQSHFLQVRFHCILIVILVFVLSFFSQIIIDLICIMGLCF